MPGRLIGYARVSTDEQDLTVQREALQALGVASERVYVDHGLTGTNRKRIGRGGDDGAGVRSSRPQPPPPSHLGAEAPLEGD